MPIQYNKEKQLFSLEGKTTQYVFAIDDKGLIRHMYWGKKVTTIDDFEVPTIIELAAQATAPDLTPEEYAPFGGLRYKPTALKVTFADNTRDLVLEYVEHSIEENILTVTLKDKHYNFHVLLKYRMHEDLDILERWTEVINQENDNVKIEHIDSAALTIPRADFRVTNITGHWGAEHQLFHEKLMPGKTVFESRKGVTGHTHSPYVILDSEATETTGEVYFGVLAYSGNFKIEIEKTEYNTTRVMMGINDFDFAYVLKPQETFTTPKTYIGYTDQGFADMSFRLHTFMRKNVIPEQQREKVKRLVYNSWEATGFNINFEQQVELAKIAADMGIEVFMIDDGWFGQRNGEDSGLGDWFVNKEKFPNGLAPLIEAVNGLGMDFGIWVEPEMVSQNSDLYRAHPDWVYNFPTRERTLARQQLVLNLTMPEVEEYLTSVLNKLFAENKIQFVKWDMNRPVSEPGAQNLEGEDQKSFWYRHTQAVFRIIDTLRKNHPDIEIQACSSGGGRVDAETLAHFDEFLLTDNTNSLDTLYMKEAYSMVYPVKAMRDWVADDHSVSGSHAGVSRRMPIEFRFHGAMLGIPVLGGDLLKYTPELKQYATEKIAQYKEIRDIVQEGKLYRLESLRTSQIQVFQYVKEEESVVFAFLPRQKYLQKKYVVKLEGLNSEKQYTVKMKDAEMKKSGSYLMNVGLEIELAGDYASQIIQLKAI